VSKQFRGQAEKNAWDKVAQAFARTKLGGWSFITWIPAVEKPLMRMTRGRLRLTPGQPVLLLHMRGAKSGQRG
jgi:hypothetical protein